MSTKDKRQLATVSNVMYGKEDHGILTCYITLDFDRGGVQGFGGLILNEKGTGPEFVKNICNLFGVSDLKNCIGKKCYALYCFGEYNERIEGLENLFGQRFTLTKFAKKHFKDVESRLEDRRNGIKKDIVRSQERIKSLREELKGLNKRYTDWDAE